MLCILILCYNVNFYLNKLRIIFTMYETYLYKINFLLLKKVSSVYYLYLYY